jgi:hypothetical protein
MMDFTQNPNIPIGGFAQPAQQQQPYATNQGYGQLYRNAFNQFRNNAQQQPQQPRNMMGGAMGGHGVNGGMKDGMPGANSWPQRPMSIRDQFQQQYGTAQTGQAWQPQAQGLLGLAMDGQNAGRARGNQSAMPGLLSGLSNPFGTFR